MIIWLYKNGLPAFYASGILSAYIYHTYKNWARLICSGIDCLSISVRLQYSPDNYAYNPAPHEY